MKKTLRTTALNNTLYIIEQPNSGAWLWRISITECRSINNDILQ